MLILNLKVKGLKLVEQGFLSFKPKAISHWLMTKP